MCTESHLLHQHEPIVLAMSANEKFIPGIAVTILSAVEHLPSNRSLIVYALIADVLPSSQEKLQSMCSALGVTLHFIFPDPSDFSECNHRLNVHSAIYFRLQLPSLLPQHDKVLYIDADMLVIDDISPLWETDIEEYPMAAVQEIASPFVSSTYGLHSYEALGIPMHTPYANSGLLLINLDLWRKENLSNTLLQFCEQNKDYIRYWDQDAINAVLAGRWKILDPTWNMGAEALIAHGWKPEDPTQIHTFIQKQRIIHFLLIKPWEARCPHPQRLLYLSYLSRTPFAQRSDEVITPYSTMVALQTPVKDDISQKKADTIVTITWARNEADIIEEFVRYHCQFVDRMIIVNNRSSDNTGEILEKLQEEGLPITVRNDSRFEHQQGEVLTTLLRELRTDPPDWVIPLDADEFLRTTIGSSFRSVLACHPRSSVLHIPWQSYVPTLTEDWDNPSILQHIHHRKIIEESQWYKMAIPGSVLLEDVHICIGSHLLTEYAAEQYSIGHSLALAHIPVRSANQVCRKAYGSYLSNVANPHKVRTSGFQWKHIFEQVKNGAPLSTKSVHRIAYYYATEEQWHSLPSDWRDEVAFTNFFCEHSAVQDAAQNLVYDPIHNSLPQRYLSRCISPIQLLAENADYLANALHELRAKHITS